jgi:hypothetical protein
MIIPLLLGAGLLLFVLSQRSSISLTSAPAMSTEALRALFPPVPPEAFRAISEMPPDLFASLPLGRFVSGEREGVPPPIPWQNVILTREEAYRLSMANPNRIYVYTVVPGQRWGYIKQGG